MPPDDLVMELVGGDPLSSHIDRRAYDWRRRYGLTGEDYERMLANQDGVCCICRRPERTRSDGSFRPLSVDHDHATGRVRGLVCNTCNRLVGLFESELGLAIRRYVTHAE